MLATQTPTLAFNVLVVMLWLFMVENAVSITSEFTVSYSLQRLLFYGPLYLYA